jgi:phosphoribosyl-AMP cyclohydrolase
VSAAPRFGADGLVPAVVQERASGEVLMVAFMNREAWERTLSTGRAWFWSRSRGELWEKGATSGNVMTVLEVRLDCDEDTVLLVVDPAGPACHTGARSCFFTTVPQEDR